MSDFLFIIPEGWTRITDEQLGQASVGIGSIEAWINSGSFSLLDESLRNAGVLTDPDQRVVEARLFNGDILVVRFG